MKITRRGFGKVIAGALAAVIVPFILDLPNEDLVAKEIDKIKTFEEECSRSAFKCASYSTGTSEYFRWNNK